MDKQRKLSVTISNIKHSTIRKYVNVKHKIYVYFKVPGPAIPILMSLERDYFYMEAFLAKSIKLCTGLFSISVKLKKTLFLCSSFAMKSF